MEEQRDPQTKDAAKGRRLPPTYVECEIIPAPTEKLAGVLDRWGLFSRCGSWVIAGIAYGSSIVENGKDLTTSPVTELDRANGWARTKNSLYALRNEVDLTPVKSEV
jgi:hypothetical protein